MRENDSRAPAARSRASNTSDRPAQRARRRGRPPYVGKKIGCLPVLDEEGTLVGIVKEADFVEFAARYLETEGR